MARIHVGQTELTIVRTVGIDITGATPVLIKFLKPSLEEGQFTGAITNAATGEITATITSVTDIDQYGTWSVWAHAVLADTHIIAGEASRMVVFKEGEL